MSRSKLRRNTSKVVYLNSGDAAHRPSSVHSRIAKVDITGIMGCAIGKEIGYARLHMKWKDVHVSQVETE